MSQCPKCQKEFDDYKDTSSFDGLIYDGTEFECPHCKCKGRFTSFDDGTLEPCEWEEDDDLP